MAGAAATARQPGRQIWSRTTGTHSGGDAPGPAGRGTFQEAASQPARHTASQRERDHRGDDPTAMSAPPAGSAKWPAARPGQQGHEDGPDHAVDLECRGALEVDRGKKPDGDAARGGRAMSNAAAGTEANSGEGRHEKNRSCPRTEPGCGARAMPPRARRRERGPCRGGRRGAGWPRRRDARRRRRSPGWSRR